MILIRPFKKSDLSAFIPIEPMGRDEVFDDELAQSIEDSDLAITGIRDGEIVGCGGTHPIDGFHGEMWLRLSETCKKYPLDTLRWIKDALAIIEETYPFKQLNATIRRGFERSIKMIEHLGFTRTEEQGEWAIYSKRVQE